MVNSLNPDLNLRELAGKIPSSILAQIEEEEAPLKTELEEAEEMLNNQVWDFIVRIHHLLT